jgi:hypothetical protein
MNQVERNPKPMKKKQPEERYYVFYKLLSSEDREWELDESFDSLADAEAYVKEKCEDYTDDEDQIEDSAWEFHILKQVKVVHAKVEVKINRNLVIKEE